MSLIERVLNNLKKRQQKVLRGGINCIPSPFIRFSNDFIGIEQASYHVITSTTKGAKTQFASFVYVFHTLLYAYNNPDKLRVKIFYYPLEETPEDILIRFISYLLYTLSEGTIHKAPIDLKSTKSANPISDDILELLNTEKYANIIKFFEDHVIFSNSTNPTGVYTECRKYAEDNGIVYKRKQKIKDEFTGETKEIDVFDHYEQSDPDEYRLIFYDHISLTSTEKGLTLKQSIDKLSEYFVLLRNRYKFSPVVIQQQSFAGEGLEAFKENKLRPTIANLADSKYPSRDKLNIFVIVLHILNVFYNFVKNKKNYDKVKN